MLEFSKKLFADPISYNLQCFYKNCGCAKNFRIIEKVVCGSTNFLRMCNSF